MGMKRKLKPMKIEEQFADLTALEELLEKVSTKRRVELSDTEHTRKMLETAISSLRSEIRKSFLKARGQLEFRRPAATPLARRLRSWRDRRRETVFQQIENYFGDEV